MVETKAVGFAGAQPADDAPFTKLFVFSAKKRLLVLVGAEVPERMN